MSKVCHAHCPGGGGLGLLIAADIAVDAWLAMRFVAGFFAVVLAAGLLLLASGCAYLAWVLRRESAWQRAERAAERRAVTAMPSPRPLPARQPMAIETRPVYQITDAGPSRVTGRSWR